jgi:23S rRNA (uracil1939-C5)-methyltransferase
MYKVEVTKLDHQGRGIAKINGKIIFIPNALPEETVDVDIILEKKKYYEGIIKEIINASDKRIKSICPYFEECGGCQFLNMNYQDSLDYKQNKVEEIMNKYLGIKIKINNIVACDNNLYYRNKTTFQVENDIGFFKEKTNTLIPVDKCYISDIRINDIYKEIKDNIDLTNVNQIIIRATKNTLESMVIFKTSNYVDNKRLIDVLKNKVDSIYINDELIYGKGKIIENLCNKNFYISPSSFFQVNTLQAEKLYNKAIAYADIKKEDTVLDLYCGTGTIGIVASDKAKKVIGIELNKEAIKDANENKKLNNINNIEFYAGDVGKILNKNNYKPDIIIVDPPRVGLDSLALAQILNIRPKKLVYVSCDLMTLARDLKLLSNDYDILELTPVDMFPYTAHVESVCALKLK